MTLYVVAVFANMRVWKGQVRMNVHSRADRQLRASLCGAFRRLSAPNKMTNQHFVPAEIRLFVESGETPV